MNRCPIRPPGPAAAALVTVLLSACSSDGDDGVPRSWIRDEYTLPAGPGG